MVGKYHCEAYNCHGEIPVVGLTVVGHTIGSCSRDISLVAKKN